MARDAVEQRGDHLRGGEPHVGQRLVDRQLLHHQLVLRHRGDAMGASGRSGASNYERHMRCPPHVCFGWRVPDSK
jgi:hypothetical protein